MQFPVRHVRGGDAILTITYRGGQRALERREHTLAPPHRRRAVCVEPRLHPLRQHRGLAEQEDGTARRLTGHRDRRHRRQSHQGRRPIPLRSGRVQVLWRGPQRPGTGNPAGLRRPRHQHVDRREP